MIKALSAGPKIKPFCSTLLHHITDENRIHIVLISVCTDLGDSEEWTSRTVVGTAA